MQIDERRPDVEQGEIIPVVTPEAVRARVMFFFAGISDLHTPIDRDYGVGRVTSDKVDTGDSRYFTWNSAFSVNGETLANLQEHFRDGNVWSREYWLFGMDENGDYIDIFLEEHEGEWQSVDISKRLKKTYEDIDLDLNQDQDAVIFETVQVEDPAERVRIARRLGVRV